MTHMPREPEAFGEQVARILHRQYPDRSVEIAGPMDLILNGRHLSLSNLYRMVHSDPTRGVDIVENYLEKLIEGDTLGSLPLPLSVAKPRIMPRIQPTTIFEHLDREQVAHVPFVNDTCIVFVIDMPQMTVSLTIEQLMRWNLTPEEVDLIARQNLDTYTPRVSLKLFTTADGGRAATMTVQDGYDAARLLLNGLHEKLAPELSGDFYAAAPARDMLVAFSAGPPEFHNLLQSRIERDFRRLPYPITTDFFFVTRDGVAGTKRAA
ncbi:MAG: DUF1444 family protein [Phycisphaerales bacterium]|jgi:hypothetical protein|nr:DUF1444 family protein [Phycisphaerales bacterium]